MGSYKVSEIAFLRLYLEENFCENVINLPFLRVIFFPFIYMKKLFSKVLSSETSLDNQSFLHSKGHFSPKHKDTMIDCGIEAFSDFLN